MNSLRRRIGTRAACATVALLATTPTGVVARDAAAPTPATTPAPAPVLAPAPASAAARDTRADSLIAGGAAGAQAIVLLDCRSGAVRATVHAPGPLAAPVVADFTAGALYAATRSGDLLRYSLPDLALRASARLGFEPTALAASRGPDALVLAGGSGETPLAAHDPDTLAALMRYPTDGPARVAAILDVAPRGRFVVGFADRPELWEVAYDRHAPEVLRGLVHDYRSREAVALPGRLTPRPFVVPSPSRELAAGASAFELIRIGADGSPGVVNLDVRREIERPRMAARLQARDVATWSAGTRRGWLIATRQGPAQVLEAPDWRITTLALGGDAVAVGPGGNAGELRAVITGAGGAELLRVDAAGARVTGRTLLPAAAAGARRIAAGSDGTCAALLDDEDRWIGRVDADR